jgi:hypothetical protein
MCGTQLYHAFCGIVSYTYTLWVLNETAQSLQSIAATSAWHIEKDSPGIFSAK